MFTSKQYVHHHRSQWQRGREREKNRESQNFKSALGEKKPRASYNICISISYAACRILFPPHFYPPCTLSSTLHPLSNANTIHFEYFRGAKRVAQIVWNNHENVYMSDVFFSFCLPFFLVFVLHFWRALKYAAPKNIWHYVFANLITPPHEKRWNENEKLTPTQLDSASCSFTIYPSLSLSLSVSLEAPCSLSVWSLLACKLHWLPRCTFLSFLSAASPSLSFCFSSAFASLLCSLLTHLICLHFVWHFALVISSSFLLTLPNANRLYFSTFFLPLSLYLSCCLLFACHSLSHCQPFFYISNTWRIYVPSLSGIGAG